MFLSKVILVISMSLFTDIAQTKKMCVAVHYLL